MKSNKKISVINLGCFKNSVDTEVIAGELKKNGIKIVPSYEHSDWLLINTCGFIREAKEEGINEILSALEDKEAGKFKYLAVFGCMIERYFKEFKQNFDKIDLLWGVNDIDVFIQAILEENFNLKYNNKKLFLYDHKYRRENISLPNTNFIKISEGCNMKCSFCAIPGIRGSYRSRTIDSIIKEATQLQKQRVQEVNIISQNSTYFGKDLQKTSLLPNLMRELAGTDIPWLRILYLMPEEITDEILDGFLNTNILPYFDLPFQHVAKDVLQPMNRSTDLDLKYNLIRKIREKFQNPTIRASFIVGFPGETEDDFQLLLRFARETKIERIGVFTYSDEDGTKAFELKDKILPGLALERKEELMDISDQNINEYNQSLIGKELDFLPLSPSPWDPDTSLGRIRSQAPEVDGFTQINTKFNDDYSIRKILIKDFKNEMLIGEPV
jgi:ribosomal protein S12 methylthiotransferase